MLLSVVIPAYNEKERIENTLKRIIEYLTSKKYKYEIIVVNDGSLDDTVPVVRKFLTKHVRIVENPGNMGKGYAVKNGVLNSRGDYILFSDADLSTPIEEFEKLFVYMKEDYDVIIGSRRLPASDIRIKQPLHRRVLGQGFGMVVRMLTSLDIKDTQCGFKLFKGNVARNVFSKQDILGWAFDVEILYIAKKKGYKIKEVPVTWLDSAERSKVKALDAIPMFKEIVKIRMNGLIGKYR